MENEDQLQGDAALDQSHAVNEVEESKKVDTVKYDTYNRVFSKLKKTEEALRERETALRDYQEREMIAKGEYEELNKSLKERLSQAQSELEEQQSLFAEERFRTALNKAAQQEGVRPEAIDDVWLNVRDNYFDKVELKDDLSFDSDQIKELLGGFRNQKPHWFNAGGGKVNDLSPKPEFKGQMSVDEYFKSLSTTEQARLAIMSPEALKAHLNSVGIKI